MLGLLVANMTLMFPRGSKPSSWVMSSSIVRWTSLSPPAPSSNLAPPMASISSKNMMHAFFVRAISKSSRTILAPSPTYLVVSGYEGSYILLHKLAPNYTDKCCICAVCNSSCAKCLSRAGRSIQHNTLWRVYTKIHKSFRL